MFIVDLNTLQTVDSLDFFHNVVLYVFYVFNLQDVMRVDRTFCQFFTDIHFHLLSFLDPHCGTVRDQISFFFSVFSRYNDLAFIFIHADFCSSGKFRNDSNTLRLTSFKQLFNTRKTLCDIVTGNTTGMEGSHCQLCTRLTDGLCSDNTNCFTNLYCLSGCHVCTIALGADTCFALTCQGCTDLHALCAALDHGICTARCDHMVLRDDHIASLIKDIFCCITA